MRPSCPSTARRRPSDVTSEGVRPPPSAPAGPALSRVLICWSSRRDGLPVRFEGVQYRLRSDAQCRRRSAPTANGALNAIRSPATSARLIDRTSFDSSPPASRRSESHRDPERNRIMARRAVDTARVRQQNPMTRLQRAGSAARGTLLVPPLACSRVRTPLLLVARIARLRGAFDLAHASGPGVPE